MKGLNECVSLSIRMIIHTSSHIVAGSLFIPQELPRPDPRVRGHCDGQPMRSDLLGALQVHDGLVHTRFILRSYLIHTLSTPNRIQARHFGLEHHTQVCEKIDRLF